jgi:hypothetical protein
MTVDPEDPPPSMYERFRRRARVSLENWRDPQHDLEAIRLADPSDRSLIEQFLVAGGVKHMMDAEALALLGTPRAQQALLDAFRDGSPEIRAAVVHVAPNLIREAERLQELLQRIGECDVYNGLDLTLRQVEVIHPPVVMAAMLARVTRESGVAAVHFAGMLLFLHGQAQEPFDWEQRPFLLRFNSGDEMDRQVALRDLGQRINMERDNPRS